MLENFTFNRHTFPAAVFAATQFLLAGCEAAAEPSPPVHATSGGAGDAGAASRGSPGGTSSTSASSASLSSLPACAAVSTSAEDAGIDLDAGTPDCSRRSRPGNTLCCQGEAAVGQECFAAGYGCPASAAAFETASGACGEHAGQPVNGVQCQGDVCGTGEFCCPYIAWHDCRTSTVPGCYARVHCDGREDCGAGEVCCVQATAGRYFSSACGQPADCAQEDQRACSDHEECPLGMRCCATDMNVKAGLCRTECYGQQE